MRPKPKPSNDPNHNEKKLAKIGRAVTDHLNENPYVQLVEAEGAQIYVYQNFLAADDCKNLIRLIDQDAQPSTLYKGTEVEKFRTSFSCNLDRFDPDVARIEQKICDTLGINADKAETMQGQRYAVGQEFKPHHDFFHIAEPYWKLEGPNGGQRTWTAMIFLNEPEEGGETGFRDLGVTVLPRTAMLLLWNNMNLDGTANYLSLHSGNPVLRGTKYIITKWFRQDKWLGHEVHQ